MRMLCLDAVRGILFFLARVDFVRALFSNLYMRTLAPGRRQKAAKVRPDLRVKDALLIKLCRAAAVERECWGGLSCNTDTYTHISRHRQ